MMHFLRSLLSFQFKTAVHPRAGPTRDVVDRFESFLTEQSRCGLTAVPAGTDDRHRSFRVKFIQAGGKLTQRHQHRARDMSLAVFPRFAHIHDHRAIAIGAILHDLVQFDRFHIFDITGSDG